MSSIKLTAVEQPSGGVGAISALLLPQLGQHFAKRAARLRQLAEGQHMPSGAWTSTGLLPLNAFAP